MSHIFIEFIPGITVISTVIQFRFIAVPSGGFKDICYSNIHCLVCHRLDCEFVGTELGGLRAVGHGDDDVDAACRYRDVVLRVGDLGAAAVSLDFDLREAPSWIE